MCHKCVKLCHKCVKIDNFLQKLTTFSKTAEIRPATEMIDRKREVTKTWISAVLLSQMS